MSMRNANSRLLKTNDILRYSSRHSVQPLAPNAEDDCVVGKPKEQSEHFHTHMGHKQPDTAERAHGAADTTPSDRGHATRLALASAANAVMSD